MTLYCVLSIISGVILIINSIFTFREKKQLLGSLTTFEGVVLIALGIIWFCFRKDLDNKFDIYLSLVMAATLLGVVLTFLLLSKKPKTIAKEK